MARNQPDPNDFVDADEAFDDDYDPEEITFAEFTIVPGEEVNHAALVYNANGQHFLGGSANTNWAISMYYGYRYNGQDIPIHDPDAIRHILEKLSGTNDLADYDWAGNGHAYFE